MNFPSSILCLNLLVLTAFWSCLLSFGYTIIADSLLSFGCNVIADKVVVSWVLIKQLRATSKRFASQACQDELGITSEDVKHCFEINSNPQ